jgi:hypothetical protein
MWTPVFVAGPQPVVIVSFLLPPEIEVRAWAASGPSSDRILFRRPLNPGTELLNLESNFHD